MHKIHKQIAEIERDISSGELASTKIRELLRTYRVDNPHIQAEILQTLAKLGRGNVDIIQQTIEQLEAQRDSANRDISILEQIVDSIRGENVLQTGTNVAPYLIRLVLSHNYLPITLEDNSPFTSLGRQSPLAQVRQVDATYTGDCSFDGGHELYLKTKPGWIFDGKIIGQITWKTGEDSDGFNIYTTSKHSEPMKTIEQAISDTYLIPTKLSIKEDVGNIFLASMASTFDY